VLQTRTDGVSPPLFAVGGRIELEGEPLPDGASVSVIVRERDGFDVDSLEAELLAAMEEVDRGEGISGKRCSGGCAIFAIDAVSCHPSR
jgi:hypothetical protein